MGARMRKKRTGSPARAEPNRPAANGLSPRDLAVAALVFAVATLVLTYPLGLRPAQLSRFDNGDARLNAWAISWVSHQVVRRPLSLFDANTFYPLRYPLAYSEHLFVQGVMALPLLAITDDLVLTNNLILLFSTFLSAFGMYVLTASLTGSRWAGLLAGLFFSFSPYRFNRLPHLQVQLYAFLPLFLAAFHRFVETRRRIWLLPFAAGFVLQVLSGTYLAAMAAVALGIAVLTLTPVATLDRREWTGLALALTAAAAVILPFVLPYLWVNRTLGVEWDLPGVGSMSATAKTYLASSSHAYRGLSETLTEPSDRTDYLFPGVTLLLLGCVGLVVGFARHRWRRMTICYAAILVAGAVLSAGPNTPLYSFLYEHIVFFRGLRALTRFGLLPLFSLSLFSGMAIAWLLEGAQRLETRRRVTVGIALFFIAESTAMPYRLSPFEDEAPEVYRWLSQAKPGPMVELPFKVIDTRYMFFARHHGFRPMLNGDSGFIPMSHQWIKIALLRFPSDDSVALLRRLEVRYVVLHLGAFRKPALLRVLNDLESYRQSLLPVRDFGRDLVFEVLPARKEPPRENLPPPLSVSATEPQLFDRDLATTWSSPDREAEFLAAFAGPVRLEAMKLSYGPVPRVPVDRVEIWEETSNGELLWSTRDSWPAVTELVSGLLDQPRNGYQLIRLPSVAAERVRIRIRGLDEPPELTEIEILGHPATGSAESRGGTTENAESHRE